MLKLLAFLPCEKIILSTDGLVTLTNVLDRVNTDTQAVSDGISEDMAVPMAWEILTLWRNENGADNNKVFDQLVEFIQPNGKRVFNIQVKINVAEHTNIRSTGKVLAFPIGVAGTAWLRLSIREEGQNEYRLVTEYPISITHDTQEKVQSDVQQTVTNQQQAV